MGDAPLLRVTRRSIKMGHEKLDVGDTFTPPGTSRWEALVRVGLAEVVEEPKPKPKPKRKPRKKAAPKPADESDG